jgi:hypothetical protein
MICNWRLSKWFLLGALVACNFCGCTDQDHRTYESIDYVSNLVGDESGLKFAFVATSRSSTEGGVGHFSWLERGPEKWSDVLAGSRSDPTIYGDVNMDDEGRIALGGGPSFAARDDGAGLMFANLNGLPDDQEFPVVDMLGDGRILFLGNHGRLLDWGTAGYQLREVPGDTQLSSSWVDSLGVLQVATFDGAVFRESGDGWEEGVVPGAFKLGRSVVAPDGSRYFLVGEQGILRLSDGMFTTLHNVAVNFWLRPVAMGDGVFYAVNQVRDSVIGFNATNWWVVKDFPGREINGLCAPADGLFYIAHSNPGPTINWELDPVLDVLVNEEWQEIDLYELFGIEPHSVDAAKGHGPLAPGAGGEQ